jgi:hypothetical protein
MLDKLKENLSKFNAIDLLAKVGALHLVPDNASRAISLDALAHLIAAQIDQPDTQIISRNRLRTFLQTYLTSTSLPGMADDPATQMFTEELLFSGGSYIVFPGRSASEQDTLRWLLRAAVLRNPPLGSKEFRDEVSRAAILCLSVSNQIAQKAGIKRGESPRGYKGDEIIIPDSAQLNKGMNAVTLSRGELLQIVHGETFFAPTIDPLSVTIGSVDWTTYSFEFGQLHHKPFVKAGDKYIVPVPSLLLVALRHRILCVAQSHGFLPELVKSYQGVVWEEAKELLGYLDSHQIHLKLPEPGPADFMEGLFTLDSDKALYVQLATDNLGDFAGEYEPSRWDVEDLNKELEERTRKIIKYLSKKSPGPDRVLILSILQHIGRAFAAGFGDPPGDSLWLAMSASDLRTIILVEAADSLLLWKYARAHHRIRETVHVVAADVLDEYEMYRASQHSYYFSDNRQPDLIVIAPGDGLEMRKKVVEELDPHGIPSYHTGYLIEVWSCFGSGIPIYTPPSQLGKQIALVVEGELTIPVWVIGKDDLEGQLREIVAHTTEALAYWLWQFQSFLAPALAVIAENYSTFVIEVDLDDPVQWKQALDGSMKEWREAEALISSMERTRAGMRITLRSLILTRLYRADNQGERELVQELLLCLRNSLQEDHPELKVLLSDLRIQVSVNTIAPLSEKKKLILLPLNRRQELDPTNLPKFRPAQEADFAELLDGVGEYIRAQGWKEGDIPKEKRNDVLKKAVEFLYHKLEELIATLDRAELLPNLIAYQETSTRELFLRRFMVPTRLACFGQREELVKKLMKEIPTADETNLANRFLIEYVAARPPSGNRHLSLEIRDQLMALALEIINWGMLSDSVHFGLTDAELSVLPSGRLGYDHEAVSRAQRAFMSSHFGGFISETQRTFASHWGTLPKAGTNAEPPPEADELDRAFAEEFGLTRTEVTSLMVDVYTIGTRQEGPVKRLPTIELITELSHSLGWEARKVERGINLMTIGPRADYLNPPGTKEKAYPWRFNRAWSHLRRPLVCTGYKPDSVTWWGNRHIIHAVRYLTQLCLGGRLKTNTAVLKQVIGRFRKQEARAFEESVARIFTEITGVPAKVRLRKVGKRRIIAEGQDLGDIDVLAVIPGKHVLLPIECKDLALARTPAEIEHQLEELVYGSSDESSTIKKHLARTKWIENNLDEVLMLCFSIQRKGRWKVKPVLISDSELHAPYITNIPFPAWSIETLKKMAAGELARKTLRIPG